MPAPSKIRIATVLAALTGALGTAYADPPPAPPPPAAMTSLEEDLWKTVYGLRQPVPATEPYELWFGAAQSQRRALLEALQMYGTVYPGGAHRDDAIRLELQTLFELDTLRGLPPDALCARVQELLCDPPTLLAEHEAAYWAILCGRRDDAGAAAFSGSPDQPDARLLRDYAAYVGKYPTSRYVPRMATLLLEDRLARGDLEAARVLVDQMQRHFPAQAATAALVARWKRAATVGQAFWPMTGTPQVVVVWAGFDPAACECAQQIERFRRAHPELRAVGVNLDPTSADADAHARRLGLEWAQMNDGLGWGGAFVRTWGVRQIPRVFVVDRAGRLVGVAGADDWEPLLHAALAEPPPPSSAPASAPTGVFN